MKNHFFALQFSIEQAVDENEKMKCILICLIIFCCGFASKILALRCASADGLSVEDVRRGEGNRKLVQCFNT